MDRPKAGFSLLVAVVDPSLFAFVLSHFNQIGGDWIRHCRQVNKRLQLASLPHIKRFGDMTNVDLDYFPFGITLRMLEGSKLPFPLLLHCNKPCI